MAESDPKRSTVVINIKPDAKVVIESIREETGVPQTEALTRILEWFAAQDRKLRVAILTRDEETQREMMGLLLQQVAGVNEATAQSATSAVSAEQAVAGIHALADRLKQIDEFRQRDIRKLLKAQKEK